MAVAGSVYHIGYLVGADKDWYHGELTRDEAEESLKASGCNCFLIRQSQGVLVLSLIHNGLFLHITIKCGPDWYELESGTAQYCFSELEEMVTYYCSHNQCRLCHETGTDLSEDTNRDQFR